jgi:hypothetical protein
MMMMMMMIQMNYSFQTINHQKTFWKNQITCSAKVGQIPSPQIGCRLPTRGTNTRTRGSVGQYIATI